MTVEKYAIRRYREGDRNHVWRVHDRAFRASPINFIPEYNRELRHIEESFLESGGEFLVGVATAADDDEERLVACGGSLPTMTDPAKHGPNASIAGDHETVELRSIRVDPAHQRRGLGRRIVLELEARAARSGFERVLVETVGCLAGAIELYRSLGYEILARNDDRDNTVVTLGRSLPRDP